MIVIPMAGMSRRFLDAGYDRQKWMLPIGNRPLFDWSLLSFAHYFQSETFLIVFVDSPGVSKFIDKRLELLGIGKPVMVPLKAVTLGQAETVHLGLQSVGADAAESVSIFNIDTIRPGAALPESTTQAAGWLECFKGEGTHWSFVKEHSAEKGRASRVAEKERISDNCCTGMYWFREAKDFEAYFSQEQRHGTSPELFVAPLFDRIIKAGLKVSFSLIPKQDIFFAGTPTEYERTRTLEDDLLRRFSDFI